MARRKHRIVATEPMVPADPITQALSLGGAEPLAVANPSTNGHVAPPRPETGDDYWARALGKVSVPLLALRPAAIRRSSGPVAQPSGARLVPSEDTAAGYWDRATGAAPRRPSLPEGPSAVLPAAAAVSAAPGALQDAHVTTEDAVAAAMAVSEPASLPTESLATPQRAATVREAHIHKENPLAIEVRGAHVRGDDPLAGAAWDAHLAEDDALAAQVRGAHVKTDDPLAASFSPGNASITTDPAEPSETRANRSEAGTVPAKARRRRWGLVPVAGAVGALAAGLGGGGAYAYFTSHGTGTGSATAGTLQAVTVQAATISPSTPLYPGVTGDVVLKVNNPNAFALSLVSVSYGTITAVGGIGACTTTGITLNTPTNLPYTINASGTTSVDLAGAATMGSSSQTGCQGATFSIPVTITVHEG
jgi:predicted ribosomally synthesized peptide with SipW-like signal peptide